MQVITSNDQLKKAIHGWRHAGEVIAFVPTMGNLHQGHLKLIDVAWQHADRVVVSIFVNPMQFNQGTDFENYPRTLEQDIEKLNPLEVNILYTPDESSIYPHGMEAATKINVPDLADVLCGEFRPGHFEGVATVVAKLFNLVQPDVAVFGEKDFQQLLIIRKMVNDLNFPLEIVGVETERESSGLALSSRNQYLSESEKQNASRLYQVLSDVVQQVRDRCEKSSTEKKNFHDLEKEALQQLESAGFKPEYLQVRSAQDLETGNTSHHDLRVFAAAWLGEARLIDNLPVI